MSRKEPDRKSARRREATDDDAADAMKDGRTVSNISDKRLDAVRDRIRDGGYNDPEIAEAVAQRILEQGDLAADETDGFFTSHRNPRRPIH